jgi:hypothetical protein
LQSFEYDINQESEPSVRQMSSDGAAVPKILLLGKI